MFVVGVLAVLLGVAMAFGFASYVQIDASSLVFILPCVLIGVGIDCMLC